jgi:hypothetical protein
MSRDRLTYLAPFKQITNNMVVIKYCPVHGIVFEEYEVNVIRLPKVKKTENTGYRPTVERILGSDTLSLKDKDILLDLYHDKRLISADVEYTVQDNEDIQRNKLINEVGRQIAKLTKKNPRDLYRLLEDIVDNL